MQPGLQHGPILALMVGTWMPLAGEQRIRRAARYGPVVRWWLHLGVIAALVSILLPVPAVHAESATAAALPVLRLELATEPHTLDPQRAVGPDEITVVRQLYEPLLRFDTELRPQPALAESVQSNDDNTVWTFTLRANARWSDGEPVTAAQVRDGWLRMMTRELPDELSRPFQVIENARFFRVNLIVNPAAVGVQALDDRTLQVTTENPAPHLPMIAALPGAVPYRGDAPSPRGARAAGTAENPLHIGNGPFRLTAWHPGEVLRLEPNPYYWGGPPAVALEIHLPYSALPANGEDALTRFRAGRRDIVVVPPERAAEVLANRPAGARVLRQPLPQTTWLSLNVTREPLDTVEVRRALSYALDRRAIIRNARGGVGRPAYSLLPPGVPGHNPGAAVGREADATAALLMLAAADRNVPWGAGFGGQDLPRFTLRYPALPQPTRLAFAIRDQLAYALGIWIRLDPLDPLRYAHVLEKKDFELALSGWHSTYPDPEAWFWLTFGDGKLANRTGWSSRVFDRLWRAAEAAPTEEERLRLYHTAQHLLTEEAPALFLVHGERLILVREGIEGIEPALMDDLPGAASLYRARVR